jgi:hypothetical protein
MSYIEPFLAHQLKNDCVAGNNFMTLILNPSVDRVGRKVVGNIACSVTGIQEQSFENNLTVSPNPTEGKLNISFSSEITTPITFELYDISGRLVLSSIENSNASKKEINIENMDKGSYILYVRQNELMNAYKIIKQ